MDKYIVEVVQRPFGNSSGYTSTLAKAFDIPLDKAESLIARLPGRVTRPVQAHLAKEIASRFQSVGLDAVVKPSGRSAEAELEPNGGADTALEADFSNIEFDDLPLPLEDTGYDTMLGVNPEEFALEELELDDEDAAYEEITPYEVSFSPAAEALLSQTGSKSAIRNPKADSAPERRGSLLARLLSIALLPTLLTLIGALVVTWFVVRPALYGQLLDSARNPAIAAAASLSSQLTGADPTTAAAQLLDLPLARDMFPRDSISFIVATDLEGNPLATSFEGRSDLAGDRALEDAIRAQALEAVNQQSKASNVATQLLAASGERYEIVAQTIQAEDQTLGTIVVGVTDRAVTAQVNRILLTTLLFSLIPLGLAILFAVSRARSLSSAIVQLTKRADEISRGDLSKPVETLNSRDELEDLGQALERLRVSMQEALARLRRRRT